ncbi:hypothetical protein [Methylobacterium sp. Gmos1]
MPEKHPRWCRRILFRAALRQSKRISQGLIWKKNVRTLGIGYKFRRGRLQSELAAIVYVRRKEDVRGVLRIPRSVKLLTWLRPNTIPTDVIEVLDHPRLSRGVWSGDILTAGGSSGTCAVAFSDGKYSYVVTNDHVVRDLSNGRMRLPIQIAVSGTNYTADLAATSSISPSTINRHDAVLLKFSGRMPIERWTVAGLRIRSNGRVGQGYEYLYSAEGSQTFRCRAIAFVFEPERFIDETTGIVLVYKDYWQLQMTEGTTSRGHSGSLLYRPLGGGWAHGAGLVFGRETDRNVALAFDLNTQFDVLGINLG